MRIAFIDTSYLVAALNRDDAYHAIALAASSNVTGIPLVCSEMVLVEYLNHFAGSRQTMREEAARSVAFLLSRKNMTIIPQSSEGFREALDYYADRSDKGWSLTDCSSILIMNRLKINHVLSTHHHFVQAGFQLLMRTGS